MVHQWPKELFIWHCTVFPLGQIVQLIVNILSLTALTLGSRCILNDAHTNRPIWPKLKMYQTLIYTHNCNYIEQSLIIAITKLFYIVTIYRYCYWCPFWKWPWYCLYLSWFKCWCYFILSSTGICLYYCMYMYAFYVS